GWLLWCICWWLVRLLPTHRGFLLLLLFLLRLLCILLSIGFDSIVLPLRPLRLALPFDNLLVEIRKVLCVYLQPVLLLALLILLRPFRFCAGGGSICIIDNRGALFRRCSRLQSR